MPIDMMLEAMKVAYTRSRSGHSRSSLVSKTSLPRGSQYGFLGLPNNSSHLVQGSDTATLNDPGTLESPADNFMVSFAVKYYGSGTVRHYSDFGGCQMVMDRIFLKNRSLTSSLIHFTSAKKTHKSSRCILAFSTHEMQTFNKDTQVCTEKIPLGCVYAVHPHPTKEKFFGILADHAPSGTVHCFCYATTKSNTSIDVLCGFREACMRWLERSLSQIDRKPGAASVVEKKGKALSSFEFQSRPSSSVTSNNNNVWCQISETAASSSGCGSDRTTTEGSTLKRVSFAPREAQEQKFELEKFEDYPFEEAEEEEEENFNAEDSVTNYEDDEEEELLPTVSKLCEAGLKQKPKKAGHQQQQVKEKQQTPLYYSKPKLPARDFSPPKPPSSSSRSSGQVRSPPPSPPSSSSLPVHLTISPHPTSKLSPPPPSSHSQLISSAPRSSTSPFPGQLSPLSPPTPLSPSPTSSSKVRSHLSTRGSSHRSSSNSNSSSSSIKHQLKKHLQKSPVYFLGRKTRSHEEYLSQHVKKKLIALRMQERIHRRHERNRLLALSSLVSSNEKIDQEGKSSDSKSNGHAAVTKTSNTAAAAAATSSTTTTTALASSSVYHSTPESDHSVTETSASMYYTPKQSLQNVIRPSCHRRSKENTLSSQNTTSSELSKSTHSSVHTISISSSAPSFLISSSTQLCQCIDDQPSSTTTSGDGHKFLIQRKVSRNTTETTSSYTQGGPPPCWGNRQQLITAAMDGTYTSDEDNSEDVSGPNSSHPYMDDDGDTTKFSSDELSTGHSNLLAENDRDTEEEKQTSPSSTTTSSCTSTGEAAAGKAKQVSTQLSVVDDKWWRYLEMSYFSDPEEEEGEKVCVSDKKSEGKSSSISANATTTTAIITTTTTTTEASSGQRCDDSVNSDEQDSSSDNGDVESVVLGSGTNTTGNGSAKYRDIALSEFLERLYSKKETTIPTTPKGRSKSMVEEDNVTEPTDFSTAVTTVTTSEEQSSSFGKSLESCVFTPGSTSVGDSKKATDNTTKEDGNALWYFLLKQETSSSGGNSQLTRNKSSDSRKRANDGELVPLLWEEKLEEDSSDKGVENDSEKEEDSSLSQGKDSGHVNDGGIAPIVWEPLDESLDSSFVSTPLSIVSCDKQELDGAETYEEKEVSGFSYPDTFESCFDTTDMSLTVVEQQSPEVAEVAGVAGVAAIAGIAGTSSDDDDDDNQAKVSPVFQEGLGLSDLANVATISENAILTSHQTAGGGGAMPLLDKKDEKISLNNSEEDKDLKRDKYILDSLSYATDLLESSHSSLAKSVHSLCRGAIIKQSNISLEVVVPTRSSQKECDGGERDSDKKLTMSPKERPSVNVQLKSSIAYSTSDSEEKLKKETTVEN